MIVSGEKLEALRSVFLYVNIDQFSAVMGKNNIPLFGTIPQLFAGASIEISDNVLKGLLNYIAHGVVFAIAQPVLVLFESSLEGTPERNDTEHPEKVSSTPD